MDEIDFTATKKPLSPITILKESRKNTYLIDLITPTAAMVAIVLVFIVVVTTIYRSEITNTGGLIFIYGLLISTLAMLGITFYTASARVSFMKRFCADNNFKYLDEPYKENLIKADQNMFFWHRMYPKFHDGFDTGHWMLTNFSTGKNTPKSTPMSIGVGRVKIPRQDVHIVIFNKRHDYLRKEFKPLLDYALGQLTVNPKFDAEHTTYLLYGTQEAARRVVNDTFGQNTMLFRQGKDSYEIVGDSFYVYGKSFNFKRRKFQEQVTDWMFYLGRMKGVINSYRYEVESDQRD